MSDFGCRLPNGLGNFVAFAIETSLICSSRRISFYSSTFCCAQYFGGRFLILGAEAFCTDECAHFRAKIETPNNSLTDLVSQRVKSVRAIIIHFQQNCIALIFPC